MTVPLLKLENIGKNFGALRVLDSINLTLNERDRIVFLGPSGSGKTTLLRLINYLEPPDRGHIYLSGELFGERKVKDKYVPLTEKQLSVQRKDVGFVFQNFNLWPHLTVLENVALAPWRVRRKEKKLAFEIAAAALEKVHMGHKAAEYPERLSGGQQQRVGIARALAQQPKVILFDEPTSALDPELVGEVLQVIRELANDGITMVLVTHEIRFARDVADRVVFMDQGAIVEQGPPAQVIDNPSHERTRRFLSKFHAGV